MQEHLSMTAMTKNIFSSECCIK